MTSITFSRVQLQSLQKQERWSFVGGPFGSKLTSADYVEDGVPVIRGGNLSGDARFNDRDFVYVSEAKALDLASNMAARGDVVFTQRGTLGDVGIIPSDSRYERYVISQSQMKLTVDPSIASSRYVYYYFRAPETVQRIHNTALSSGVPHINLTLLREFVVEVPSLQVQRRIAAALSAYDDLIENNAKRIRVLEEMARGLYREWFVNFRYPGHAGVGAESGLPARWELRSLVQCAKFLSGGTPSKARPDFWQGDIPWVSSGELTAMRVHETSLHVTSEGAENGSRIVPPETILCVVRGMSLAKEFRLGLTTKEMAFNQDLKAIVGEPDVDNLMLFHALDAQRDEIRKSANEAAHGTKKLDTPVLSKVQIVVPPAGLQRMFREHIVPIHDQWDNLTRRNTRLRAARDLLLPKLLAGQLSVDRIPDPAEAAG